MNSTHMTYEEIVRLAKLGRAFEIAAEMARRAGAVRETRFADSVYRRAEDQVVLIDEVPRTPIDWGAAPEDVDPNVDPNEDGIGYA